MEGKPNFHLIGLRMLHPVQQEVKLMAESSFTILYRGVNIIEYPIVSGSSNAPGHQHDYLQGKRDTKSGSNKFEDLKH